jgi:hypothetical protein
LEKIVKFLFETLLDISNILQKIWSCLQNIVKIFAFLIVYKPREVFCDNLIKKRWKYDFENFYSVWIAHFSTNSKKLVLSIPARDNSGNRPSKTVYHPLTMTAESCPDWTDIFSANSFIYLKIIIFLLWFFILHC